MIPLKVKALFFMLFFMMPIIGNALSEDREEIMHVVADSANLDQKKHEGTYSGHVEFNQGTTNIHATKAVTQGNEKNQLTFAMALGSQGEPAHYWTHTDPGKPPFHAYADQIKYYPLQHLIELIGNARVEQGNNSLSAAKISYDTLEKRVISQGNSTSRIKIILYPEKKNP